MNIYRPVCHEAVVAGHRVAVGCMMRWRAVLCQLVRVRVSADLGLAWHHGASHGLNDGQPDGPERHYDIPKPTWTCPHCGFIHVPASLLRPFSENLQCRQCWKAFLQFPILSSPA